MNRSPSSHKVRNTFLILFIVSTILAVILLLVFSQFYLPSAPSVGHPSPNTPVIEVGGLIAGAASCLTAIVSFFGFLATLFFGWRKEKRESLVSELERKRLEMELEKQRLEVSRLRAEEKR